MKEFPQLLIFFLCIIMLSACSNTVSVVTTPTQEPTSSATSNPSPTPTVTLIPSITPSPIPTATPTPLSLETILARNYPATMERSLVEVEIVRFLIGEKDVVLSRHPQLEGERITPPGLSGTSFAGKDVVGELVLRITNKHTERLITMFLSGTEIGVGGQQIRLEEFILDVAHFGDDINPFNPDIFPDTSVLIGYWFAFDGIDVSEITKAYINIDSPCVRSGSIYRALDNGYFFAIDFSEPVFEPLPEELY